jgi:hypothetical protein
MLVVALLFGLSAQFLVGILPHWCGVQGPAEDPSEQGGIRKRAARADARQMGASAKNEEKTMIQQDIKAANAAGSSCLVIGQNRQGLWVVRDARSVCGGLFGNRTEAIRFAMYECQRRPQSVIMLPDGLELDLGFGGDLNVNRKIQRAA